MKRIFIFLLFIIGNQSVFSQSNWQYYTKIADSLQLENKFSDALKHRLKAIENAQLTKQDTLPFLKLLGAIGKSEADLTAKNSDSTYESLKQQAETLKGFNATSERLYRIYNRLYTVSNQKKNIDDSDYFISKSVEYQYQSKTIDSLLLLETLQNAGSTYRQIGKLNEAVAMFLKADKICENLKIEDPNVLGLNYMSLSELHRYRYLDSPKKFIKYLKKAQVVYENANAVNDMIRVYLGFSDFMSNNGKFQQSINYLKKALQVYKKDVEDSRKLAIDKRDIEKELKLHNYFIEKYRILGNEKQMSFHLNEMLQIATPKLLNDNAKDLICLSHLYLAEYYEINNDEKALVYLNQGSKYFPTEDLYSIREEYDMHFVNIFMNNDELDKAKTILKGLNQKKGLPLFIAKSSLEKSIILNVESKNYEDAYTGINHLLKQYYDADGDVDIRTLTYDDFKPGTVLSDTQRFLNIAQAFETMFKDNVTETLYWLALKQFQTNLNQEILNDRINALYSDVCHYFYSKALRDELGNERLNQFLTFTEVIESKHLFNMFVNNRKASKTTELDSLIRQEQSIRANITYLKKQNIEKQSDSINQLIFEDNLKLEKINEQLKLNSNGMAGLVNTDKVLEQAKEHHVVKFKRVNQSLFRIIFNKSDNIRISEIKDYDILKDKVIETVSLLKDPNSAPESIIANTDFLFDRLLGNIDILNGPDTVYIIPDHVLHYLPFELLTSNNEYLLKEATISYASNLSFINNGITKQELRQDQRIALFAPSYKSFAPTDLQLAVRGDPYYLEGTLKEVETISKLFDNSKVFINDNATKASFTELSSEYSILHLSMHSFINDKDAELSSLVFTDGSEDYELYISELYGLNLNADMAVLSACNTGVGELKTGQGLVSMNTAFTAAGVPSVLSSLWSAPDLATQQIMTSFYKYLKTGNTKDVALKKAKLDYLKNTDDPNLKHPYYWAGFVLSGDTSAITSPINNYLLYFGLIVLVTIIIFLILKKRLKLNRT